MRWWLSHRAPLSFKCYPAITGILSIMACFDISRWRGEKTAHPAQPAQSAAARSYIEAKLCSTAPATGRRASVRQNDLVLALELRHCCAEVV